MPRKNIWFGLVPVSIKLPPAPLVFAEAFHRNFIVYQILVPSSECVIDPALTLLWLYMVWPLRFQLNIALVATDQVCGMLV
jgi:hypothetical protein